MEIKRLEPWVVLWGGGDLHVVSAITLRLAKKHQASRNGLLMATGLAFEKDDSGKWKCRDYSGRIFPLNIPPDLDFEKVIKSIENFLETAEIS
jgi:hypothetical protein